MTEKTTKPYSTERRLFYTAVFLVLALFAAYTYFVSASVVHVVVRKELTRELADTQTRISSLEAEYISAQNSVGYDTALARGFEKNEEKVFVKQADPAAVLTLNDTR